MQAVSLTQPLQLLSMHITSFVLTLDSISLFLGRSNDKSVLRLENLNPGPKRLARRVAPSTAAKWDENQLPLAPGVRCIIPRPAVSGSVI